MLVLLLLMLVASLSIFWIIFIIRERITTNISMGKFAIMGEDTKYVSASVGIGRKIKFRKGITRIRSNTR